MGLEWILWYPMRNNSKIEENLTAYAKKEHSIIINTENKLFKNHEGVEEELRYISHLQPPPKIESNFFAAGLYIIVCRYEHGLCAMVYLNQIHNQNLIDIWDTRWLGNMYHLETRENTIKQTMIYGL